MEQVELYELNKDNVVKVLDEVSRVQPHAHVRFATQLPPLFSQVRPYLMADGGDVEFVEIDGLVVKLRLTGACGSCPSSLTTMTMGIKRRLMEKIPVSLHTKSVT